MTQQALLDVIILSPDGEQVEDDVKAGALMQLCQHLLVLDGIYSDPIWRFPHASVAEWLEKKWSMVHAQNFVAKVCLSQLMRLYRDFDPFSLPRTRDVAFSDAPKDKDQTSGMDYIRYCWFRHIQAIEQDGKSSGPEPELKALLKQFLGSPMKSSLEYQRWVEHTDRTYTGGNGFWLGFRIIPHLRPSDVALFGMVVLNFTTTLGDWWEVAEMDTAIINDEGRTLLALSESTKVSKLLLKRGADPNQPFMWRSYKQEEFKPTHSVLIEAVGKGGLDMVKLLVQGGADVNAVFPNQHGSNALNKAASYGHMDIVKYLVEDAKANVNVEMAGTSGTPATSVLMTAVHAGELDIVKYLVEVGKADVNKVIPTSNAGDMVSAASFSGQLDVLKYFIEEVKLDADAQVEHESYGSALAAATSVSVVRYLTKMAGVDVNMHIKHGRYGSALAAHAAYTRLPIVKYLVEEGGADVNLKLDGHRHINALVAAKSVGELNKEVITYLESVASPETKAQAVPGPQRFPQFDSYLEGDRYVWKDKVDLDLATKDFGSRTLARKGTF